MRFMTPVPVGFGVLGRRASFYINSATRPSKEGVDSWGMAGGWLADPNGSRLAFLEHVLPREDIDSYYVNGRSTTTTTNTIDYYAHPC